MSALQGRRGGGGGGGGRLVAGPRRVPKPGGREGRGGAAGGNASGEDAGSGGAHPWELGPSWTSWQIYSFPPNASLMALSDNIRNRFEKLILPLSPPSSFIVSMNFEP